MHKSRLKEKENNIHLEHQEKKKERMDEFHQNVPSIDGEKNN
jgi:hypothetical protein